MQTITQSCWVPYPPQAVYQVLTDPDKLIAIVKRLKSIEVLSRQGETGDVRAVLDLPGGKTLTTCGSVVGHSSHSLMFSTNDPLHLIIAWELTEHIQAGKIGTTIGYRVEVDLSPVAAFVSGLMLKGYLSSEMKRDLQTLEDILAAEFTVA